MSDSACEAAINKAVELLRSARYVVAFTGAGISTPSGIPDFRSHGAGLWQKDDPMVVASLTTFRRKPEIFYNWLRPLAKIMWETTPNSAHLGLSQLEKAGFLKAIITQNIDGLHQKSGTSHVIEVHGTMNTLSCLSCRRTYPSRQFQEIFIEHGELPTCPDCQRILKPDIVLFEEALPDDAWAEAHQAASRADLMLVIGSSLTVMPACRLPDTALMNGARLIINNLSATPLDGYADVIIPYNVVDVIPQIAARITNGKGCTHEP